MRRHLGVVVPDDLAQGLEAAIVHVGRPDCHVAQGGGLEAAVAGAGVEPVGVVPAHAVQRLEVPFDVSLELVEADVARREADLRVAGVTPGAAGAPAAGAGRGGEQEPATPRGGRQPVEEGRRPRRPGRSCVVVGRTMGHERPHELREGPRHPVARDVGAAEGALEERRVEATLRRVALRPRRATSPSPAGPRSGPAPGPRGSRPARPRRTGRGRSSARWRGSWRGGGSAARRSRCSACEGPRTRAPGGGTTRRRRGGWPTAGCRGRARGRGRRRGR